jgi:fumarate reductase subunit D
MTESFFENHTDEKPSGEIPDLDGDNREGSPGGESSFKTDEGRLAAVMSYIPFLCFIPLLNMKHNAEARFHARQGVMLFLIELIAFLFLFDRVADFVFTAILIVAVAFSIAGIYFALQGKNYRLPIVGDLADKSKL